VDVLWMATHVLVPSKPTCVSQSLNEGVEERGRGDADGGKDDASGLVAFRTRSKRPLRDIPLGQLEAELLHCKAELEKLSGGAQVGGVLHTT